VEGIQFRVNVMDATGFSISVTRESIEKLNHYQNLIGLYFSRS